MNANQSENQKSFTWNLPRKVLRNLLSGIILDSPLPIRPRATATQSRASVGITCQAWTSRASRLWALGLSLAFTLAGCGGDSGTEPIGNSEGIDVSSLSRDEVASMSSVSCLDSPTIGTWKALHTGDGSNTYDTVEIGEDCYFRSFVCGTVGYIDSDVSDSFGITTVVYLGNTSTASWCPLSGVYRCNYRISAPAYHEMVLDCLPD